MAAAAPAPVVSQPLAPISTPQLAPQPAPTLPPGAQTAPAAVVMPPVKADPVRYGAAGKVVDAKGMYRSYVVRKGDHLDAIARDLQTTRATIVDANRLKKPDSLVPGQRLKIPIDKAYVVQSGDTAEVIAKRFDVTVADLADLNAIGEDHHLRSGDRLALPSVINDKGPVALPQTHRLANRAIPVAPWRAKSWSSGAGAPAYPSTVTPAAPSLSDSEVMAAGKGRFVWPVDGEVLSTYGVKDVGRRNDGVDVKAAQGAPVHASAAGEVVYAGDQVPGFGNLVLVKHSDGWVTAYAHLEKVTVHMRESVAQNQQIGLVGQSGGVPEPQLHFEIRYAPSPAEKAKPVDPMLVLPKQGN